MESITWIMTAFLVAVTLFFAILFMSSVRRNGAKSNVHADGKDRFRVNGRRFTVHAVTGPVRGAGTVVETHTHVTGNAQHVNTTNTTYKHDSFFIERPDGRELEVSLTNSGIRLRDGHLMTAVWVMQDGGSWGPFVHFHNHHTGQDVALPSQLRSYVKPSKSTLLWFLLFVGGLMACLATFGLSTLVQQKGEMMKKGLALFAMSGSMVPGILVFGVLPFASIVFFSLRSGTIRSRIATIQQQFIAPVVQRAKENTVVAGGGAAVSGS